MLQLLSCLSFSSFFKLFCSPVFGRTEPSIPLYFTYLTFYNNTKLGARPNLILVCQLPKDPGPCTAREAKYYFDTRTRRCEQFTFGGCQGNANKFSSQSECERACHELLVEKEVGELAVIFSQFDIHRCENTSFKK